MGSPPWGSTLNGQGGARRAPLARGPRYAGPVTREAHHPTATLEPAGGPLTASALRHWLGRPADELEQHAARFIEVTKQAEVPPQERAEVARALLILLESEGFGRASPEGPALRRAVVEAVLRLGYPWALHLDPDDVTHAREEALRRRPAVRWRRVALVLLVIAALAAVASTGMTHRAPAPTDDRPTPPRVRTSTRTPGPAATAPAPVRLQPRVPASDAAVLVAVLRAEGKSDVARAVAEACVVAYEQPHPCLLEAARLFDDQAARSGSDRDAARARRWRQLVEKPSDPRLREQVRALSKNDFVREASLLPPPSVEQAAALMTFVERAATLQHDRAGTELEALTGDCTEAPGQYGAICRAFRARAKTLTPGAGPLER